MTEARPAPRCEYCGRKIVPDTALIVNGKIVCADCLETKGRKPRQFPERGQSEGRFTRSPG